MTFYRGIINGSLVSVKVDDGAFFENKVEFTEDEPDVIAIVEKQMKLDEIKNLKEKLQNTDYIACKIAEGEATKEEYAQELKERRNWRAKINELEGLIYA